MPKVTILGAGITGMSIASQLPKNCDVTILGEFLPGDPMDQRYTSQWAGAIWLGVNESSPREQVFQLGSFAELWRIAERYPESGARHIEMTEILDYGSKSDVWFRNKIPGFRALSEAELPKGAKVGHKFHTTIITPPIFLPWFRKHLEDRGVTFKRAFVKSLRVLKGMGHDVLINATGFGATKLLDVQETKITPIRQQNIRLRRDGYNRLYIRRGLNGFYSTAFARGDGTVYVGGIKTTGSTDFQSFDEQRTQIMRQQHECQPDVFPSPDPMDYEFITDHTGVMPVILGDKGGVKVEKERMGGQKVIHAYGQEAGGYTFSFGIGRQVAEYVQEYLAETPDTDPVPLLSRL